MTNEIASLTEELRGLHSALRIMGEENAALESRALAAEAARDEAVKRANEDWHGTWRKWFEEHEHTARVDAEAERDAARAEATRNAERVRELEGALTELGNAVDHAANVAGCPCREPEGTFQISDCPHERASWRKLATSLDRARALLASRVQGSAPPHLIHDFREVATGRWECSCGRVSAGPLTGILAAPSPPPSSDPAKEE